MDDPIGAYHVIGTLGKGAGSTIMKVRREADGRVYALKVIQLRGGDDRRYFDQAHHEYEIARGLRHPHIRAVYRFEKQHKLLFLSGARVLMEYVDGQPLTPGSGLPLVRLLAVFFKVADGLAYLHGRGVFHADIKPENILVSANTRDVKIIDLGLAWRRGEPKDRVQGTLEFLAPEQANDKLVNEETDIFNLGATMYRLLTGHPVPSQLRDPLLASMEGMDALVRPPSQFNPGVPEDLDALVRASVRRDPGQRPASMAEVRDTLRQIGKRLKKLERAGED